MDAPTLRSDRLILRAIQCDDWDDYAKMWADPRVTQYIGGAPRPREIAWPKFVQGAGFWPLLGYGYWAILARDGGFAGIGGFARHERGIAALEGFPECGWTLAPGFWGKGIATEAVAAMVAWADVALGAETRCLISVENLASIKVAERNGYRRLTAASPDSFVFTRPVPSRANRAQT